MSTTVGLLMVLSALSQVAAIYGATIGLLAIGFRLTQTSTGYMNLGHTVNLGAGMMMGFIVIQQLKILPILGVPFAFILTGILNSGVYRLFYCRMEKRNYSEALIGLFGLAFLFLGRNILTVVTYLVCYRFESDYWCGPTQGLMLNHLHYREQRLEAFIVYLVSLFAFYLTKKTRLGAIQRGLSENPDLLEICGINTQREKTITWFISGGLAGIAGMISPYGIKGEFGRDIEIFFVPVVLASILIERWEPWVAGISGLLVGFLHIIVVNQGQMFLGVWFGEYWGVLDFVILSIILYIKDRKISWLSPRIQ